MHKVNSDQFELRQIGAYSVLFVMALDAEYGPCLKARFKPFLTGVGPVEAALALGRLLSQLEVRESLPDLVVSLGSAGSARLKVTHVYQANFISYRDMDASPLGFESGVTPFLEQPAQIAMPISIPGVETARLSTGGGIVSGLAYQKIPADMVDMESYAVLRACQEFNRPMVALRGISDGDDTLHHYTDWTQYLGIVDQNLAQACDKLCEALTSQGIIL